MIAPTATATKLTKDTILSVLLMENPYEIKESPNKSNVTYSVEYMPKDSDHELHFGWLVDELIKIQSLCERTIIYCQTIKQCGIIYATIKGMLGKHMYVIDANGKTTTQPRRTTKCVCNIVFPFVYRSVEHAVLVVKFRLTKVAHNIYLDL